MAATTLSQASRFNPGADLWVTPPISQSHHTLQIDWYLNFQISQTEHRQRLTPSEELKLILQKTELAVPSDITENRSELASLMVSAVNNLPCRWVVVLNDSQNLSTWTKDLFSIWQKLGQPSLRVFLPAGVTAQQLLTCWRGFSSIEDLAVVLDS